MNGPLSWTDETGQGEPFPFELFSALLIGGLVVLGLTGCGSPAPPMDAPSSYDRLVRLAAAEARARGDTTFLWLRNNEIPEARSLMLDLGVDYVRYDREAGAFCAWAGGGLGPATGYGYRLPSDSLPVDSIAQVCYGQGRCEISPVDPDRWVQFQCW